MTESSPYFQSADEIKPVVAQKLRELPLLHLIPEEDAAALAEKIARAAIKIRRLRNDSQWLDFSLRTAEAAKAVDVPYDRYIASARKHYKLFFSDSETIRWNVTEAARLLNVTVRQYTNAALEAPPLFYQDPQTVFNRVQKTAELLGVELEVFIKAALKDSRLFYLKPQRIADRVSKMADLLEVEKLLGVGKSAFILKILDDPEVLERDPQAVADNAAEAVRLLGLEPERWLKAVLENPHLLLEKAQTINDRVTKAAELLGISRARFIEAALKKPVLFGSAPETVASHANWMKFMAKKGMTGPNAETFYLTNPYTLTLADNNFALRYVFAKTTGYQNDSDFSLIRKSRYKVEDELIEALGFDKSQKKIARVKGIGGITLEEEVTKLLGLEKSPDEVSRMETIGAVTFARGLIRSSLLKSYKLAEGAGKPTRQNEPQTLEPV